MSVILENSPENDYCRGVDRCTRLILQNLIAIFAVRVGYSRRERTVAVTPWTLADNGH